MQQTRFMKVHKPILIASLTKIHLKNKNKKFSLAPVFINLATLPIPEFTHQNVRQCNCSTTAISNQNSFFHCNYGIMQVTFLFISEFCKILRNEYNLEMEENVLFNSHLKIQLCVFRLIKPIEIVSTVFLHSIININKLSANANCSVVRLKKNIILLAQETLSTVAFKVTYFAVSNATLHFSLG